MEIAGDRIWPHGARITTRNLKFGFGQGRVPQGSPQKFEFGMESLGYKLSLVSFPNFG
jgi:hypothetical protein